MTFLDDYELVADRLARFWKDHPNGRVFTELCAPRSEDSPVVTFRATVWFDKGDEHPAATGWASETPTDRGVNATSALENCETSALGRALANCNYAPKVRPSREEMTKVADYRLVDIFADKISKCTTAEAIHAVGKEIRSALQSKDLTKIQYDTLARLASANMAALMEKATKA